MSRYTCYRAIGFSWIVSLGTVATLQSTEALAQTWREVRVGSAAVMTREDRGWILAEPKLAGLLAVRDADRPAPNCAQHLAAMNARKDAIGQCTEGQMRSESFCRSVVSTVRPLLVGGLPLGTNQVADDAVQFFKIDVGATSPAQGVTEESIGQALGVSKHSVRLVSSKVTDLSQLTVSFSPSSLTSLLMRVPELRSDLGVTLEKSGGAVWLKTTSRLTACELAQGVSQGLVQVRVTAQGRKTWSETADERRADELWLLRQALEGRAGRIPTNAGKFVIAGYLAANFLADRGIDLSAESNTSVLEILRPIIDLGGQNFSLRPFDDVFHFKRSFPERSAEQGTSENVSLEARL